MSGAGRPDERPWLRLHRRMIWVDAIQSLLALTPGAIAVLVFGVAPTAGTMWPMAAIAAFGVGGAVRDVVRWVVTRYRVTDEYVELRTGVFVRRHRSVHRDRVRSVDATAKLRHRLAGLRVVNVGAGQQATAGEYALALDAVSREGAERLRRELLAPRRSEEPAAAADRAQVYARLRPSWVLYNIVNSWAFLMAAGLLWGGFWLASTLGLDVVGLVDGLADWSALGWGWTIAIAVAATGALGVIGLALNFFTEYWNFELARVPGEKGTVLRTRRGLFQTREVNRDDSRMRGLEIREPLVWRWMGMADTNVITTGLDQWSMSQPAAILPRGPITVARRVAAAVLGTERSPLDVPLRRHPRTALRRRLWWGTAAAATVAGILGWLAIIDVAAPWTVWLGAAFWPIALLGSVVGYRALGHSIAGGYLVTRSGLITRTTAALQRKAVSTVAVRQSLFQRRLGLKTVSAMTAAGWGAYTAPDIAADEAVAFAAAAAPGLLQPFLEESPE